VTDLLSGSLTISRVVATKFVRLSDLAIQPFKNAEYSFLNAIALPPVPDHRTFEQSLTHPRRYV
jgi:hypothetical protein